ncbi:MAG TPA: flagellar hook protein FlgE [Spirochaetia bacterium]|nr:flagellar hook protein FlgE [Spirochaetia bacterium]
MMRSLWAGVSGLENHQVRMDVIGNNIANVNTTGFKKGRVDFQDLISQTMEGAARPQAVVGGVNPKQVGLGMNIAAIGTIFTQGSLQTTGVKTDVAIQGDGFFVLRQGDQKFYTRAGAFGLDADGMLVNPSNGMRVQGWKAQTLNGQTFINTSADTTDLQIPVGSKDPAHATGQVDFMCNLNKSTPLIPANPTAAETRAGTWTVTKQIYDSFGQTHDLQVDFTRVAGAPNRWEGRITIDPNTANPITPQITINGVQSPANTLLVQYGNDGTLQSVTNAAGGVANNGALSVNVTFPVPNQTAPINPATGQPGAPVTQTFAMNLGTVGSYTDSMTQFSAQSSTKIFKQDGYTMGYLQDFRIDPNGEILGIYSNGTNRPIGQLAMAQFVNPGGLSKAGENNYQETINSGNSDIGPAGLAGRGKFIAGALEMSNVDLAESFADMIVTQRGFEANSKTIQTSDQMLQVLLTLKR